MHLVKKYESEQGVMNESRIVLVVTNVYGLMIQCDVHLGISNFWAYHGRLQS